MLNFSPDHLDRHPSVEAYAAAKARIFENQDARRLGGGQRRRSGGAGAGAPQRARHGCSRARGARRGHGRRGRMDRRSARRPRRAARAARRDPPARAASGRRRDGGGDGRRDRRRGAGRDDRARSRRFAVSSTRWSWSPRVDGVRFVNDSKATNVEVGAALDRELRARARADHRRPVQGRRSRGCCASRCARARQGGRRDRRSRGRSSRARSADVGATVHEAGVVRRSRVATALELAQAGRRRAAGARRARASTCSATTRNADGGSRRKCAAAEAGDGDAEELSRSVGRL